jgi:L-alanine-DL-glutamate epimerase-like enolase superfamily enzyme
MPDVQRVGGATRFLRIAHLAAAAGMPVSGHTAPEMTLSLMATLANGTFLEVMPWSAPVYADRLQIEKGCALASSRPGWGFSLDPEALKRYALA